MLMYVCVCVWVFVCVWRSACMCVWSCVSWKYSRSPQAARVTRAGLRLRRTCLEIRSRPYSYTDTPQLDLDSLVLFTNNINMGVKAFDSLIASSLFLPLSSLTFYFSSSLLSLPFIASFCFFSFFVSFFLSPSLPPGQIGECPNISCDGGDLVLCRWCHSLPRLPVWQLLLGSLALVSFPY